MSSEPEPAVPALTHSDFSEVAATVSGVSLSKVFSLLEQESHEHPITIRRMLQHLSGRGYPAVIALFSVPAILPVIAVPMGFVLIFSGLRMAFARKLWIPARVQDYELPQERVTEMVRKASVVCLRVERYLKPRYSWICIHSWSHPIHGVVIALVAMMLPLPIPGTNWLYALPLVLIGLGLMENDGLVTAVGDILGVAVLVLTVVGILLGKQGVEQLWDKFF
jgi:hypothetical protein